MTARAYQKADEGLRQAYNLGDAVVAVKDWRKRPQFNDRLAKLGKLGQRYFAYVVDDLDGDRRGAKDFFDVDGRRSTVRVLEPDNLVLRDHSPRKEAAAAATVVKIKETAKPKKKKSAGGGSSPILGLLAKFAGVKIPKTTAAPDEELAPSGPKPGSGALGPDDPTSPDQVLEVRLVADRENRSWTRPSRSTPVIDQQDFQLQAGVENALWVRLVHRKNGPDEQEYDAAGESTWVTGEKRLKREVKVKKAETALATSGVLIGFNPDPFTGALVVPVSQPFTTVAAKGGATKAVKKEDAAERFVASVVLNATESGGFAGGWVKDPGTVKVTGGGDSTSAVVQVTPGKGVTHRHVGQLAHVLSPVQPPAGSTFLEGVTEPGDKVELGALGFRPDVFWTSRRKDIYGPLAINAKFWDLPGEVGHVLLGDLYWSNLFDSQKGQEYGLDENAAADAIPRPETPWRLAVRVKAREPVALHLPPLHFFGNFCRRGNDPRPFGPRAGILAPGVAPLVDWGSPAQTAPMRTTDRDTEALAPGFRFAAHEDVATGKIDEVAVHLVLEGKEYLDRRCPRTRRLGAPDADLADLWGSRLERFEMALNDALLMHPLTRHEARRLARLAADALEALADLRNGRTSDPAAIEAAYAALSGFSSRILGRPRRTPTATVRVLPPASATGAMPLWPSNPSGLRMADGIQHALLTLNALAAARNADMVKRLMDLPSGDVRDVSDFVTAAPDGRVFHADENGDLEWDADLQFDRTNKRLGVKTATPKSTLDVQGSIGGARRTVAGNATLDETDHTVFMDATAASRRVDMPLIATAGKRQYTVKKILGVPANTVTLFPAGADSIEGAASLVLQLAGETVTVESDGVSNWWVV